MYPAAKGNATEKEFRAGKCFEPSRWVPVYARNKHFTLIKDSIVSRLDSIKNDLRRNLEDFVESISARYIAELAQNADAKKAELDAIMEAKATAEQIQSIIQKLSKMSEEIETHRSTVKKIKGGINRNV